MNLDGLFHVRHTLRCGPSYRGQVAVSFKHLKTHAFAVGLMALCACSVGGSGKESDGTSNDNASDSATAAYTPAINDCASLAQWLAGPGAKFRSDARVGTTRVEIQYVPPEWVLCQEHDMRIGNDPSAWKEELLRYEGTERYLVRLTGKDENASGADPWTQLISAGLERHFSVVSGTDTIVCAFAHMEPALPGRPGRTIVLGFDKLDPSKDRSVIVAPMEGLTGQNSVHRFPSDVHRQYEQASSTLRGAAKNKNA